MLSPQDALYHRSSLDKTKRLVRTPDLTIFVAIDANGTVRAFEVAVEPATGTQSARPCRSPKP